MKGVVTVGRTNDANKRDKNLTFKNNAPFRSCISIINTTFIENAEDLYIFMSMYSVLEYSDNSVTSRSLAIRTFGELPIYSQQM